MKNIYFFLLIFLTFSACPAYAQKEFWGTIQTNPTYNPAYPDGALVKTDSEGNNITPVHIFSVTVDGRTPSGPLIEASNGKIYGTISNGGAGAMGTLFEYDPIIDSFQVVVDFGSTGIPYSTQPVNGLIEASPGVLYGTAALGSVVFTYNLASRAMAIVTLLPSFTLGLSTVMNGVSGPLYKASDGYIYGTTSGWSACGSSYPHWGTVFRINPATNIFSYMYPFLCNAIDGNGPRGGFVESAGKLYSTNRFGGVHTTPVAAGDGVIFAYDLAAHTYTKTFDFKDSTGYQPWTSFTKGTNGKFYGCLPSGTDAIRAYTATLYEFDPATNIYARKYGFFYNTIGMYPSGATSSGGVLQASNGKLYAATEAGIFEYDLTTGSMLPKGRFYYGNWEKLIEICRKPGYRYYSNFNQTACPGSSYTFDLHNSNAQTYVWRRNGVIAPAQTTGILHFASVAATDSGTWVCTMTNQCGITTPPAIHIALDAMPVAGLITGASALCVGTTTTMSNGAAGGVWSSSNATAAVSGSIVTGVSAGTDTIIYTVINTCGTAATTKTITVNPLPGSSGTITGPASVCAGATITLTDAVSGGVWSSSNATASVSGGFVTGLTAGVDTISYMISNSCGTATATKTISINPLPVAGGISGPGNVCIGSSITLSTAGSGGAWNSGMTGIATVAGAGIVTGMAAGSATISYSVTNGCGTAFAIYAVTVNPMPAAGTITGSSAVCAGATITLSGSAGGGVWSGSATTIATVVPLATGSVVTGISAGTATVSYTVTNTCGTAVAVKAVTVNPLPVPGTITGGIVLCAGATLTLSTSGTGGGWSSGATGVATVSGTGIVMGVAAGSAVISYSVTNGCGTVAATRTITVNPLPVAGTITGGGTVCVGATLTLSDPVLGGVWSSSATGIATVIPIAIGSVVTGVAAGSAVITYTFTNSCGTASITRTVTVNPLPNPGTISGGTMVCPGATLTLSDPVSSGTWTSGSAGFASVGSSTGVVTGLAAGSTVISYGVTNSCGTTFATTTVIINPSPDAGVITGPGVVCVGATVSLSDAATGGVWSTAFGLASVSGGIATGVFTGVDTVVYLVTNICGSAGAIFSITVNPAPYAGTIKGLAIVCMGEAITLSDNAPGGIWSTGDGSIASIGASGIVTGTSAGTVVIAYAVTNSCGTATASYTVAVDPCNTGVAPPVSVPAEIVRVYPNPAHNELVIENAKGYKVRMYNIVGQEVYKTTILSDKMRVDVSDLVPGLYAVSLIKSDGSKKVVRLVKE